MISQVLTLSALVALGQTKAIITNNCRKDVYIWSIPEKLDLAQNLPLSPGKRYEEPWRWGTVSTPGIAIKVSTERDGIYTGKSEINFQYDVDSIDSTKIWIDLATVRGNDFDNATLNTCHGGFKGPNVFTRQCSSNDDIELVLCGFERTVPAQDTTSVRVISNCIGLLAERDNPLHPRMCSGRVVGPKRMRMLPDEREEQYMTEQLETIPLKTVMRFEAAKHAASQDVEAHDPPHARNAAGAHSGTVAKNPPASGPMCNLLHEAWPDAQCSEQMAQHNAKLFYRDNCGKKTSNMFPEVSCEAIRRQMERIYPDIVTKRDDHLTMCIKPYYSKFSKFWGSQSTIKAVFNSQGITEPLFRDRSWTSDEEYCQKSNKTVRPMVEGEKHKFRRCVNPFCEKGYRLPGDCSDVEDELQKISQDAGLEIDWTSDDDVCLGKYATTKKIGVHIAAATKRDPKKVCINKAYEKLVPLWGLVQKRYVKVFLNNAGHRHLSYDVSWTSDEEQCNRYNNNTIPILKDMRKQRPCVKPFCKGGRTQVKGGCSDVEDAFNEIFEDAGVYVDWTTDDDACEDKRNMIAERDVVPTPERRYNDVRHVCIVTANEKLGKYWGVRDTEDLVEELFPDIYWTSDLDDCSPQAISESRTYHGKLIDKKQNKEKKCIPSNCEGKTCKRVKKELNRLSKDVGKHWSWTDDEIFCGKNITSGRKGPDTVSKCVLGEKAVKRLQTYWGSAYNSTFQEIFPDLDWKDGECNATYDKAAQKWYHDHRVKGKNQRCVSPYCNPFQADCSDVEDQLEAISKNIGYEVDWTTDDDVCPDVPVVTSNKLPLNEHTSYESEACAIVACRYFSLFDKNECLEATEEVEEIYFEAFGLRIKFRVDGPVCYGAKADQFPPLPPAIKGKRGPHKVCRKELCRRSIRINNDCQKIERNLKSFLNKIMQVDVEFTDSKDVCDDAAARAALGIPAISPHNATVGH